jgi:ubiquinone/menaquinone biosynthesis C-methylase UbiE
MPGPENQGKSTRLAAETERLKAAYARRQCGDVYSCFNPGQLFLLQERERRALNLLRSLGLSRLADQKILEVGCGIGHWLGEFVKWGARPENLTGIDLLSERLGTARSIQAAKVGLVQADATHLPFPAGTFDLVLQSTVFTSILDAAVKQAVAKEMLRVLKPQGLILWYDYHRNNPRNKDVRGVKKGEIYGLFPGCRIKLSRVTLAPPLARRIAPYSFLLCALLERLLFLNTHYLGIIRKAA